MKRHSLTHRVVLVVVLVELLCVGCFSGVALWHEWRTRVGSVDALLQGRSDSLLGAVQDAEDPADNVFVDPAELTLPSGDLFSVYNEAGALLGGNERNAFPLTERSGAGVRSMRYEGRSYRVLERNALRIIDRPETGGAGIRRPVTLVYAIPISTAKIWHEILEAAGFYILTSLGLTAATVLLLLTLMRGLLRPVQELAGAAAGVSPATLNFHAPASAARVKELEPLVTALSAAIDGLREAFEKQHRFVGDAAHELKTAVAVVRSTVQVLSLRPRSVEEYRSGLDAVLVDNERVEELVGRMLLLANAEETGPHAQEVVDLAEGVAQVLLGLGSYATARQVSFRSALEPDVRVAIAADALRTLATNLVVNAIQHSNEGSIVVVRIVKSMGPTPTAVLEVEDYGQGIESTDLPFVFDRFYRADSSRSRETGGAGLGLAICKSIVEGANGRIELESAVGRGTTARVSLPLAGDPSPPTA